MKAIYQNNRATVASYLGSIILTKGAFHTWLYLRFQVLVHSDYSGPVQYSTNSA